MNPLRWIIFLPTAAVCGYLAYFVGGLINNLVITLFLGAPSEGSFKVASDVMAHMYLGTVFMYSAVRIAPSAPKSVAFAALLLLLVFAGLSVCSSFAIGKFYALPAIGGVLFGGIAVLIGTFAGEVVPYGISKAGRDRHT